MRKPILFFLVLLIFSCDDGDLQIETIDFDSVSIQSCTDDPNGVDEVVFFKINQEEALLLDLQANLLENETSVDGSITSSFPSSSQLIYRLFSDNVSTNYFCDAIPALSPLVVNEFNAIGGEIVIETTVSAVTSAIKTYQHAFSITDLSLVNDDMERLTDESTLNYGTYNTTTESSVSLIFSNYDAINTLACDTPPVAGQISLYKLINDEFIRLDIPAALLANEATITPRTGILGTEATFTNGIIEGIVTADMLCSSSIEEDLLVNEFISSEGELSITTVENAPDADGIVSFTHTINLNTFKLRDVDADLVLDEIANYTFGTFTTTN